MTIKECLNQAYAINKQLNRKILQIEQINGLIENISPLITDMPKSKNTDDKLGDRIAKKVDLQNECVILRDELIEKMCEIADVIYELHDSRQREVLNKRFLEFKDWAEIANEMHVSYHYVIDLQRRGIAAIAKISQTQHLFSTKKALNNTTSALV